jgi:hypothetical protein
LNSISRCSHPPGTLEVNIDKVFTCHTERRKNKSKISEVGVTTMLSEVVRWKGRPIPANAKSSFSIILMVENFQRWANCDQTP